MSLEDWFLIVRNSQDSSLRDPPSWNYFQKMVIRSWKKYTSNVRFTSTSVLIPAANLFKNVLLLESQMSKPVGCLQEFAQVFGRQVFNRPPLPTETAAQPVLDPYLLPLISRRSVWLTND
ncbi:hypothetical protein CEXT_803481 [Caerostris extrusa]|uniref:Uncharacterized protein n=1 Tax=Caerostris extrusa TaxID=172846 RepID=A0AAV4XUH9_CAEEX|nr:hypothetical protein CEXT_803481 [Caerostris extrusa]